MSSSGFFDIQYVLRLDNKYPIKEMSIVDTYTWATQYWIFKHSNKMQNGKSRKN